MGIFAQRRVGRSNPTFHNPMEQPRQIEEAKITEYKSKHDELVDFKSKVSRELFDLMIKLLLERSTNMRNLMVLAGALASLSFLVIDRIESSIGTQIGAISDMGLLLVIVLAWLEMHLDVDKALNKLDQKIKDFEVLSSRSIEIYEKATSDRSTEAQLASNLKTLESEFREKINSERESSPKKYVYDLITALFIISLLGLVFSLILLVSGI